MTMQTRIFALGSPLKAKQGMFVFIQCEALTINPRCPQSFNFREVNDHADIVSAKSTSTTCMPCPRCYDYADTEPA